MSELSKNLLDRQEMQRQKTINIVLRAIAELKAEHYSIKIKDLLDYTGLSRSVFSKPHIRPILEISGIAKSKDYTLSKIKKPTNRSTQICNLKKKILQKEEYILKLTSENEVFKSECALLRGRLYLLMQRQSKE